MSMPMSTVRLVGQRFRCVGFSSSAAKFSRLGRQPVAATRLFSVGLQRPAFVFPAARARGYATQPPVSESTIATLDETPAAPSEHTALIDATSDPLSIADTIVQQIPPLAYGDFAVLGLSSWSPIGLIAWSYELIQVTTGLPWFYTIVAGSALCRFFCVPFALANIRNSTKLRPYQAKILQARERMTEAQVKRDAIELQRASLEMKKVYQEADVRPITGMIFPMFAQLPVTIGMFFALRRMCQLPVEQLKDSGIAFNLDLPWTGQITWLQDLTIADPTYILPATFCALINIQIMVGAREMDNSNPSSGHIMNLFRGLSILTIYFMSSFPVGLFMGLLTTSGLTIAQSLLLRSNAIRRLVGIPVVARAAQGKLPSLMESIRFARSKIQERQAAAIQAHAQQQFQQGVRRPPRKL